jgi:hypothetical protein
VDLVLPLGEVAEVTAKGHAAEQHRVRQVADVEQADVQRPVGVLGVVAEREQAVAARLHVVDETRHLELTELQWLERVR